VEDEKYVRGKTHSPEHLSDVIPSQDILRRSTSHDSRHSTRQLDQPQRVDLHRLLRLLSDVRLGIPVELLGLKELNNRHDGRDMLHSVEDDEDFGGEVSNAVGGRRTWNDAHGLSTSSVGGERLSVLGWVAEEGERGSLKMRKRRRKSVKVEKDRKKGR